MCERGRAQHGTNSESFAAVGEEWQRRRGVEATLGETLDYLRACHRRAPFLFFNEAIKRNRERFPADFMFQLNGDEAESLRSQFAILKKGRGQHRKFLPYAFTENGAVMAANVLNSQAAVRMSVFVVRAFVKMRELLGGTKELARQLANRPRAYLTFLQPPESSCARCSVEPVTALFPRPIGTHDNSPALECWVGR